MNEIITSLENEKVKKWTKLKQKKYRTEFEEFIVEGEHLVLEAIKKNQAKELIFTKEQFLTTNVNRYEVSENVMRKLSSLESLPTIMAVCKMPKEEQIGNHILLIDALQDPGNLGTIIRSAVAFDVNTIILGNDTVDLYNDKVIRATEGMLFAANILKKDLSNFIPQLKKKGYKIFGTKVDEGREINKTIFPKKTAFIIGNEGAGVKEELLNMSDEFIYIPMSNSCESLNAAIATSIILYEMRSNDE